MASEIRVDKINSLSGVGTVTLSPTGVDIAGITTVATFKVGTGVTASSDGDIFATGVCTATSFVGNGSGLTNLATDLVNDTSPQLGGNLDTNSFEISLDDGHNINFGDGSDCTMNHSGADFAITNTTGNLNILNNSADAVQIRHGSETMIKAISDGAVEIYHDGTKQCETSANGLAFPAGKGIDFSAQTATSVSGASATAEVLDHYEEGTWTPSFLNVTVTGYGHQSGTYTRIGRAVHCQFQISVDSGLDTSDTSAISIGGLPFSGNSAHEACVFSFGKLTSILSNTRLAEVTNFRFGGNFIQIHRGSSYDLNYSHANSSGHMQGAFTYQMS